MIQGVNNTGNKYLYAAPVIKKNWEKVWKRRMFTNLNDLKFN